MPDPADEMSSEQIMSFLNEHGLMAQAPSTSSPLAAGVHGHGANKKRKVDALGVGGTSRATQAPAQTQTQPQTQGVGVGVGVGNGPSSTSNHGSSYNPAPTAAALQHLASDTLYNTYDWSPTASSLPSGAALGHSISGTSSSPQHALSTPAAAAQLPPHLSGMNSAPASGHSTPTHAQALHHAMQAQVGHELNEAVMAAVRNARVASAGSQAHMQDGTSASPTNVNGQANGNDAVPDIRYPEDNTSIHNSPNHTHPNGSAAETKPSDPNADPNLDPSLHSPANDDESNNDATDTSHLAASDEKKPHQPFSRTPECKVSHKLAERKRRKEMKDLFDELKDHLPPERNAKTSKWEVLSRAIEHVQFQTARVKELERELERTKRELDMAKTNGIVYGAGSSIQQIPHVSSTGTPGKTSTGGYRHTSGSYPSGHASTNGGGAAPTPDHSSIAANGTDLNALSSSGPSQPLPLPHMNAASTVTSSHPATAAVSRASTPGLGVVAHSGLPLSSAPGQVPIPMMAPTSASAPPTGLQQVQALSAPGTPVGVVPHTAAPGQGLGVGVGVGYMGS